MNNKDNIKVSMEYFYKVLIIIQILIEDISIEFYRREKYKL